MIKIFSYANSWPLFCFSNFFPNDDRGTSDPSLIVPGLSVNELNSFMVQILSESENSERQISFGQNMYDGVMQHFCIFDQIIGDFVEIGQEILFDDNCSNVELSKDVSTDVDAVQELSDKIIFEHFTNQNDQLVCRVCYKIFPSNCDVSNFREHLSNHSLSNKKLKQLLKMSSNKRSKTCDEESSKTTSKSSKGWNWKLLCPYLMLLNLNSEA